MWRLHGAGRDVGRRQRPTASDAWAAQPYDNLRTAADRRDLLAYITDLVRPGTPGFAYEVSAAIEAFGLADELDHFAQDLPYSRRRLLAVARAVASARALSK